MIDVELFVDNIYPVFSKEGCEVGLGRDLKKKYETSSKEHPPSFESRM